MAKYEEVFEDTQALFNKLITQADLERFVNIKVLANNTLKKIGIIKKSDDLVKHMTKEDVIIIINEKIFEQLTEEQKLIQADALLAYVSFDSEKDKVVITKPDFEAHTLVLKNHTYPKVDVLRETIKTLYAVEKAEADAAKAARTSKKKAKSFA